MFAYVGSFTTAERNGRGNGVNVFHVDEQTGIWTHIQGLTDLTNPTALAVSPDQRFLYSVHIDADEIHAFAIRRDGTLHLLNRQSSGSTVAVAAALAPSGRHLVVANYSDGTVALLPIDAGGRLVARSQLLSLRGRPGPHKTQQTGPHPHDVRFDPSGRFVLVPDKGLDRVFVLELESSTLRAIDALGVSCRSGAGPRHIAFHPVQPYCYLLNELDSTIATYDWDSSSGQVHPVQILPTLPQTFTGDNTSAEIAIAPTGRFVYASNRGHDSVAIYAVDPQNGRLQSVGWVPSGGKRPRFITFDPSGTHLFVANEASDMIVAFQADSASGGLTRLRQTVATASPTFIAFANHDGKPTTEALGST